MIVATGSIRFTTASHFSRRIGLHRKVHRVTGSYICNICLIHHRHQFQRVILDDRHERRRSERSRHGFSLLCRNRSYRSRNRRANDRVRQINLRRRQIALRFRQFCLSAFHLPFQILFLLRWQNSLREQLLPAVQVSLCFPDAHFVHRRLRARLLHACLQRPWIDFRNDVALSECASQPSRSASSQSPTPATQRAPPHRSSIARFHWLSRSSRSLAFLEKSWHQPRYFHPRAAASG